MGLPGLRHLCRVCLSTIEFAEGCRAAHTCTCTWQLLRWGVCVVVGGLDMLMRSFVKGKGV